MRTQRTQEKHEKSLKNEVSLDLLPLMVERIEAGQKRRLQLAGEIRASYAQAKMEGHDTVRIRNIVALRKWIAAQEVAAKVGRERAALVFGAHQPSGCLA